MDELLLTDDEIAAILDIEYKWLIQDTLAYYKCIAEAQLAKCKRQMDKWLGEEL